MRVQKMIAALLGATVLVSVGSVAEASVSAKKIDPCAVLSQADIDDVLGGTSTAPNPIGTSSCQWDVTSQPDPNTTTIETLFIGVGKLDKTSKKDVAKNSKAKSAKKIKGIKGAKVAFYDLSIQPALVQVVKGKTLLNVQLTSQRDPADVADSLIALAKVAAGNL